MEGEVSAVSLSNPLNAASLTDTWMPVLYLNGYVVTSPRPTAFAIR